MRVITFLKINKAGRAVKRSVGKQKKIRLALLGLPAPRPAKLTTSIDMIRSEVTSLASRGLGQGVRARATGEDMQGRDQTRQMGGRSIGRGRVTE